uniref:Ricin B-type lectin domain-containing protein n=1 Tax=Rhabditophanes sp. KR3021 TaxID=114890 RepID=A0AC35TT59_9BILA
MSVLTTFFFILLLISSAYGCLYHGIVRANGQEWRIEKDIKYVKKCTIYEDGSWDVVNVGCLTPNGTRILANGEYFEDSYVKECTKLTDGSWSIKQVACLTSNKTRIPNNVEWTDDKLYVKRCDVSTDGYVIIKTIGCMTSDLRTIPANGEWKGDSYVNKCTKLPDGSLQIKKTACLSDDQTKIPVNVEWNDGSYVKKCTGQEWMELDYVWKCSITDKKSLIYKSGCKTSEGKKIEIGDEMLIKNMYLEKCGYNEYTACMTPDKQRIPINGTWLQNSTVKKCDDIGHGALLIIDIGCVTPDETKISINGSFVDEKYQWNCINVGKGKVRLDKKIVKCEGGFSVGARWISNSFENKCMSNGVQQLVSCIHPVGVKIGVNETKVIEGKTIECIEFLNHTAVMRDQTTNLAETDNNSA